MSGSGIFPANSGGSSGGAVSSVSNSDGTLNISPTTGSIISSINLSNPNTWTGEQTFNTPIDMAGVNQIYFGNDTLSYLVGSTNKGADITIVNNTSSNLATGGTITTVGGNEIHTFISNGTFTPLFTGTVNVLVVGGGGGGGFDVGGGGGAGGYQTNTSFAVISGNPVSVTIGAGGAGSTGAGSTGATGSNSTFGTITANGGGGGGSWDIAKNGLNGGSGGGGGGYSNITTGGSGNQGSNGGSNTTGLISNTGAGGGGSSGAGSNSINGDNNFVSGGAGTSNSISGSPVTYAAGGKGVGDTYNASGPGGANTGNGGDGGGNPNTGSAGGSGIVIVSIPKTISSETSRFTTGGNLLVGITSASLTGSGNIEANGIIKADTQLIGHGTSTNDNAVSGYIGEYVTSILTSGSSVSLSNNTASTITNITLTSGDWDVTGVVDFHPGVTTATTYLQGGISTVNNTLGSQDTYFSNTFAIATTSIDASEICPTIRLSLSSGTSTAYLIAVGGFSISTLNAYGTIRARRIR